jgi:uncharacterized protein
MNSKNALIIFQKNAEIGKVKTRLAATIGDENALAIFQYLVNYTCKFAEKVEADKFLFYSDYVDNDVVLPENFKKMTQNGIDLGERMSNAFRKVFELGYENVIIIGTDCYELNAKILNNSFQKLAKNDLVIGPANDGGYYLLGMKKLHEKLFQNKIWSSDSVAYETMKDIEKMQMTCFETEPLNDIDTEQDLGVLTHLLSKVYA